MRGLAAPMIALCLALYCPGVWLCPAPSSGKTNLGATKVLTADTGKNSKQRPRPQSPLLDKLPALRFQAYRGCRAHWAALQSTQVPYLLSSSSCFSSLTIIDNILLLLPGIHCCFRYCPLLPAGFMLSLAALPCMTFCALCPPPSFMHTSASPSPSSLQGSCWPWLPSLPSCTFPLPPPCRRLPPCL